MVTITLYVRQQKRHRCIEIFFFDPLPRVMKIELPYDPAIPLLGIQTEETRIERDTGTPVFIAVLFTIVRT